MTGTIHIVGAGLAGLACALRLAGEGRSVALHEAARMAGGRCRSYYDPSLDLVIDNGNHLLLSGNAAALDYARRIGSLGELVGPKDCVFDFLDTRDGDALAPAAQRLAPALVDFRARSPRPRLGAARLSRRARHFARRRAARRSARR